MLILAVIITILSVMSAIIFYKYTSQTRQLKRIGTELGEHLAEGREDKILLLSEEKTIQDLLVKVNQLIDRVREADRQQRKQEVSNRKMLSNISHDLKTPLTVIAGYAEMLERDADINPKAKQKVAKIQSKAQDVLGMIAEFFDVVKIEAGEFPLHIEPIDLCEICREEILGYYQMIEAARIEIVVDLEEETIMACADRLALKRVFANLIENAVKYGADGRYLKIRVYRNGPRRCIEIIDHGKGIVEDSQDKVFERLFTLEDSRNKKYQGSGLGLTITKRLVEAMNGTLTMRSIPYEETVFKIEL